MTTKPFLFFMLLVLPVCSFAQPGSRGDHRGDQRGDNRGREGFQKPEPSTLSVFSENGELFFLVLNGVNQNNAPTSKIRVEGLPQFGNDVQIMFADNVTPGIRRRVNVADPLDGKAVNMTLKIERGRDGAARLKFFKCRELEHNFRPEQGEYVMYYGNPNQLANNYNDPNNNQVVTQTTVTTDYGQHRDHDRDRRDEYTPPPPPPAPTAMDPQSFNDAMTAIKGATFDDSRMTSVKTILGVNYVNTGQVREVCNAFTFDQDKMAVVKFLYPRTIDQNNYFKLADMFSFDSYKDELNKFIIANRK